jgi:hypothetical protein
MATEGPHPISEQMPTTRIGVPFGVALIAGLFLHSTVLATPIPAATVLTKDGVEALALNWFAQMQKGQIDRTRLAPEYNAQLTDAAVRNMSQYLKEHDYGTPPLRAEVMQKRTDEDQTFYEVKLVFPRGDAASLLFGFNAVGKITGVSLLSMAGD